MIEVHEIELYNQTHVQCADGKYRIARGLMGCTPLRLRLRDALAVFRGDALAVRVYSGHETLEELKGSRTP